MRKSVTTFYFRKITRDRFHAEVVPWLETHLGYKRGDKADWEVRSNYRAAERVRDEVFIPTKRRPEPRPLAPEWFTADVQFSSCHDAARFLLRFEDDIHDSWTFLPKLKKRYARYDMDASWAEVKSMIRWLVQNIQPHHWDIMGVAPGGPWSFFIYNEDAKLLLQLLAPSKALVAR